MTSPFEGLARALNQVFGAPVTILPLDGPQRVVRGIFRDLPSVAEDNLGRPHNLRLLTLQVRKSDAAGIARGALVEPSIRPGETFVVLGVEPDASPGDTFLIVGLEAKS